jgi:hypothetical protein
MQANESVKIPPVDEQQFLLQPPDLLGILTDVVRERTGVVINIVPDVEATVAIGAIAALLIAIVSYLGRTEPTAAYFGMTAGIK